MFRPIGLLVLAGLLTACSWMAPRPAGIGRAVEWSDVPGWQNDQHAESWPALLRSCPRVASQTKEWAKVCREVELLGQPDDETARAFFESRFTAHEVVAEGGGGDGLITGYYEPLLRASRHHSERFRYPLYRRPNDLLTIELGELYPELKGKTMRGRLTDGRRIVPYYSRAQIDNGKTPLKGQELAWVDDAVALFFLHIQGSGRLRLPEGNELAVGYVDQNGHPYEAIGARLIRMGALTREQVSLETIRDWLASHPDEAEAVLNSNPSYIFFEVRDANLDGPLGSLNVALTAERSVAVDRRIIPLGSPVWLDTSLPDGSQYQRLMQAQDTGGAIKGAVRADVFFGKGERAEQLAGNMKQPGRLYVLQPNGESNGKPASSE